MEFTIKNETKSIAEQAYYRQRLKNRVYEKLVSFLSEQCNSKRLTRRDLADILGKDPAAISRWLRGPTNLTLDTISDLLLAVGAEAEPPEIVPFEDRRPANYIHPLARRLIVSEKKGAGIQIKISNVSSSSIKFTDVPPADEIYNLEIS